MSARTRRALEPPLPHLGEVLDFMRLIWAVDHALQKASKRMMATLGVTGPQRLVIRIVSRFPGLPAGRIAEILHVHPSTLTGVLKRLERQGLIRRRGDPKDGRRSLTWITRNGRAIDLAASGTVEAGVQRALAAAPPRGIAASRALLAQLAEALSGGPPSPGYDAGDDGE
jgi:MarR family transcriptional regulator, organic hydroperoxide resistance regulator